VVVIIDILVLYFNRKAFFNAGFTFYMKNKAVIFIIFLQKNAKKVIFYRLQCADRFNFTKNEFF
jgi:hypothetical protein